MKKALLSVLIFASSLSIINAQVCSPDNTLKQSGIYPNPLPDATAGTSYSQVIQFKFPKDTTYQTVSVPVDSAHINSIDSLPAGFTYIFNKKNSTYTGGEVGCATIIGSPTQAQVKSYKLSVNVTGYFKFVGFPVQQNFKNSLTFNVKSTSGFDYIGQPQSYTNELKPNYPNPFKNSTTIDYTVAATQQITFKVYDILGNAVYQKEIMAVKGENQITFERNGLKNGLYFYSIQVGDKQLTRRMMIDN